MCCKGRNQGAGVNGGFLSALVPGDLALAAEAIAPGAVFNAVLSLMLQMGREKNEMCKQRTVRQPMVFVDC